MAASISPPLSRRLLLGLAVGLGLVATLTPLALAQALTKPQAGSPLRKQVLDGLRPRVEAEIGGPVAFQVQLLNVHNGWAFIAAKPQRPGGRAIDWDQTPLAEAKREGMLDDGLYALLQKQDGAWNVVELAIGPTDVAYEPWPEQHRLPRELFGMNEPG